MFRSELAWREFYADVLWHRPETARENYDRKFDRMRYDHDEELFQAWQEGSHRLSCGTDAAPYFREFNPLTQAKKFDPDGAYVRRYAPDSRNLTPIVDHAVERQVALDRYQAIKS